MPKVKLAHILPLAQLLISGTLLLWGYHSRPPFPVDTLWLPTAASFCYGLSEPATRMTLMILAGLPDRVQVPLKLGGFYSGDLLFLVVVVVLWYLVGKRIDLYRSSEPHVRIAPRAVRVLANLIPAIYGLYLLIVICLHNVVFTNPRNGNGANNNFVGTLIEQILWFVWSVILIVVPSFALRTIFSKGAGAGTPPAR